MAVAPDVPAGVERHHGAVRELQQRMDGGWRVDRDLFARAWFGADGALLGRRRSESRDSADGPDQLDQVGDVVGPDIEHGAGAWLEEEIGIGVPVLHAVAHHVAGATGDPAELAAVDQLARQLMRAAEECVRCRTDAQPLLLGPFLEVEPFLDRQHERLFRIDVLAGLQHRLRHFIMHGRNGEVDDDVDLVVLEKVVGRLGAELELLRPHLRRIHVDIRAGAHLDAAKQRRQREIRLRDVAAADNAYAKFVCHDDMS